MYLIKCDGKTIYDPRIDELKVLSANCKLKVNSVCEASFSVLNTHPIYADLKKLSSVIEIHQDNDIIFRGRITDDTRDFHKQLAVDVEGVLACANDTIIPPFVLEGKTLTWGDNTATYEGQNVVEFLLGWVLDRHNENVKPWQKLMLGNVDVEDPNNVLVRSSEKHASTWDTLKDKFFESTLGGYLYVRYEPDGNFVDYVNTFPLDNLQRVSLKENVVDVLTQSDANATYTAILPIGKDGMTLGDADIGDLPQGYAKKGDYIYSEEMFGKFGWICVPISESTWDDVTDPNNLKKNAINRLSGNTLLWANTITIKAVDLHFSDKQISTFKPYRNTWVDIPTHGIENVEVPLTELEIDLLNPQSTIITLGKTVWSILGINQQEQRQTQTKIENIQNELRQNVTSMAEIENRLLVQSTQLINDCNTIILAALESYVETSNFEEYKETVSAQLQILADEIVMNFTSATEQINNVDGDLQAEITKRLKYITFSENGITIGAGENAMQLELDNNMIKFKKNGLQFGWWDGVDFHTGNIVVEVNERAQFGNFAFVPRSDGSLMFLKVGG